MDSHVQLIKPSTSNKMWVKFNKFYTLTFHVNKWLINLLKDASKAKELMTLLISLRRESAITQTRHCQFSITTKHSERLEELMDNKMFQRSIRKLKI